MSHTDHPGRGLPPRGAGLPRDELVARDLAGTAPPYALQLAVELRIVPAGEPTPVDDVERYGAEVILDGTVTLDQARRRLLAVATRQLAEAAVRRDVDECTVCKGPRHYRHCPNVGDGRPVEEARRG